MSSGGELKIYLRGVTPHTLIHGGLGHRHLLCEDLVFMELYLDFFAYSMFSWKTHSNVGFYCVLLLLTKFECEVPFSVTLSISSHALLFP